MPKKRSKAISFLLAITMTLSVTACSNNQNTLNDPFSSVTLTENERAWSNQDDKYANLLDMYSGQKRNGAMAVATDQDIVYLFCKDDKEKDGITPVSQDTVFDIASVSKMFTAICILQLSEKGKLSVDDTLDKYFPEYETGKDITIYNLLHMTSGIPDYCNNPDPFWNISGADAANQKLSDIYLDKITDEEFLQAMYKAPLEFEPGEKVSYSNTNYRLLAFIIEQVTDKKYCDYVQKNIFDKCGMKKTTSMALDDMTYVPGGYDELVKYGFTDENGYPACPNNSRGDGGIHSCLTDMIVFDRALFSGKLISEKSMEILLNDDDTGYCCGLRKNSQGYSHDGSSFTCSANNKIIESEEFGHVYVITFDYAGMPKQSDDASDAVPVPLSGTNYTKGVYENGVYVNDYAEIKLNGPSDCMQTSEENIRLTENFRLSLCTDRKDKLLLSADIIDSYFESGSYSYTISIEFVNTRLGIPHNPDCTEDEYLDIAKEFLTGPGTPPYAEFEYEEREKVNLGNKEYLREVCSLRADGMHQYYYDYARRIDDDLISIIEINGSSDFSPEFFEQLFEQYETT